MSRTMHRTFSAALSIAALALAAGSAEAAVAVDDATPSDGQTLTATVSSPPSGAQYYTLAECDVSSSDPADWPLNCNGDSAVGFTSVSTPSAAITVDRAFDNVAYGGGSPTSTSTTCAAGAGAGARQCGVIVSWYKLTLMPPFVQHLSHEKVDITF